MHFLHFICILLYYTIKRYALLKSPLYYFINFMTFPALHLTYFKVDRDDRQDRHTHTHFTPTLIQPFDDNLKTVQFFSIPCYISINYTRNMLVITRRNQTPRSRSMSDTTDTQRPHSVSLSVIHQSERRGETRHTNQNAGNLHSRLLDVTRHYKCLKCQTPSNRIKLVCMNKSTLNILRSPSSASRQ